MLTLRRAQGNSKSKFMTTEKIGVFVDVQNIYYTTREEFGRSFDYRRFWDEASAKGEIVLANAYAIERQDDNQKKFQRALRHIGFEVKLKPYIQRSDGSRKGDWDVGIAVDVLQSVPALDRIFLLSGDGDFDLLVDAVQTNFHVPVEIYSVEALSADSLIRVASSFHPILESSLV